MVEEKSQKSKNLLVSSISLTKVKIWQYLPWEVMVYISSRLAKENFYRQSELALKQGSTVYIGEYPPSSPRGNISRCHLGEKIWKGEEKKEENVKEKGRKGKEN
jgi:hypothetical protein